MGPAGDLRLVPTGTIEHVPVNSTAVAVVAAVVGVVGAVDAGGVAA